MQIVLHGLQMAFAQILSTLLHKNDNTVQEVAIYVKLLHPLIINTNTDNINDQHHILPF
jgi:hypothetical protein